ncbi:hypothetical protein [Castellaniella sp.]|uniref:hypothetical protein n=1 Tax=Castellaniella sp. TaxID=1955812 RepID=UPI002AFFECFC|nr:hypothetical protein [Castellaniella sp.]
MFKEILRRFPIGLIAELHECKIAGPLKCDEQIKPPLGGMNPFNIDVEEAECIVLEALPLWSITRDIGQMRDIIALQALMQG